MKNSKIPNLLSKQKRFIVPILTLVIISIITITSSVTYININIQKQYIKQNIKESKIEFLKREKELIHQKVHQINKSINFVMTQKEKTLKKDLKAKIRIAFNIAYDIYNRHKDELSDDEIRKKIIKHLSVIKFNDGRGYYCVVDLKTKVIYTHGIKELIGTNVLKLKDAKEVGIFNANIKALEKDKIAFTKRYYYKPNDKTKKYQKLISIIKFEPLNLIIGTGEYLDVVEEELKNYLINRFNHLNMGKNKYLFILDLHNINGGDNFATMLVNPNRPDLIGKKLNDNYEDGKGKKFRKEFLEGLRQKGEIYTKYWYKKPNYKELKPKMSYFYLQKDLNWVVASGFYFDDLEKQIIEMETHFNKSLNNMIIDSLLWVLFLSFFVVTVTVIISFKIDRTIKKYTNEVINLTDKNMQKELLLFEQSKMANMGAMIGNIVHQWKQPLNVISLTTTGIQFKKELGILDVETIPKEMEVITNQIYHLTNTLDTFKNFLKEKKEFKEMLLQDRINVALNISGLVLKDNGIELKNNINYSNPIKISLIIGELTEVLINVINNAIDILIEKKIKEPWVQLDLIQEDNKAIISIEDNGGGIPSDVMSKLFDKYFTTKNDDKGTGLGLHMSYQIITKSLNGKIYA
ncbi:MAG: cache domain-containing protein, partial [Arcobacteraceae bacterium]|nr:cache domain-containing protein [Arcobacteraceae bacterium]